MERDVLNIKVKDAWMMEDREVRRRIRVTESDAGRAVSDLLARQCPEVPAGFLNRLVRKGFVTVNGHAADGASTVQTGDRVALALPVGGFLVAPNKEVPYSIVHEDEALLIVDKPAGVVSEPGIGHKLDTLLNGLIARYPELDRLGRRCDYGMVHRLDRDTSGLLVVARTVDMQRALVAAFRGRRVVKRYTALVTGRLQEAEGVIRTPLGRTRRRGRAVPLVGEAGGQRAVTEYAVTERFKGATLIDVRLHTGRWRQIRLHFAALGCPVAGDFEEGDSPRNRALTERAGLSRMFLHAGLLAFERPETGAAMEFRSPLPEPLSKALARLRR